MNANELKSIKLKIIIGKNNEEKTITLFNLYQMFMKHARYLESQHAAELLGDL